MNTGIGKIVAQRLHAHVSALDRVDATLAAGLQEAERVTDILHPERYNVARFEPGTSQVGLLQYRGFSDDPFPALNESWRFDLTTGEVSCRLYQDSLNSPILHRKELLLPKDHPPRAEHAVLTEAVEAIGLFNHPTHIGYRHQW